MKSATVALVDDHMMVRRGMASLLENAPDIEVVGEASDAESAILLLGKRRPDVVFLDLEVPGAGGLGLVRQCIELLPDRHVVVFSAHLNEYLLRTCLALGVDGYLTKTADSFSPAECVRKVMRGEKVFDPQVVSILSSAYTGSGGAPEALTGRELEVLHHMGDGLTNMQIAAELGISENTVKGYAKAAMAKLGAKNRTEAAVRGYELGLI